MESHWPAYQASCGLLVCLLHNILPYLFNVDRHRNATKASIYVLAACRTPCAEKSSTAGSLAASGTTAGRTSLSMLA